MLQNISDHIKKPIIVALSVLLLFILIIVCKFYLSPYTYPKSSGISGLLAKNNIDYLFIGSSLTRQSYDIKLIESKYHVNAYSLAYNGMSPILAYKILKYTLENTDIHIKTIIMEAYPYRLFSLPNSMEDVRMFNASPSDLKMDIIKEIYNYDHNLTKIYDLIVLADNENLFCAPITYQIIDRLSYNGGYTNKIVPGISRFNNSKEPYGPTNANQKQISAYMGLIDICKKNNISLIFVEPFVPKYIQDGINYRRAKGITRSLIINSGNVFYENNLTSLNNNDQSLFGDDMHLSTKGRNLWSQEIMRLINAHGMVTANRRIEPSSGGRPSGF